jgi:hypothetical protein
MRPSPYTTWMFRTVISVEAKPTVYIGDTIRHTFTAWSDGGDNPHELMLPDQLRYGFI